MEWYISRMESRRRESKVMVMYVAADWIAVKYDD